MVCGIYEQKKNFEIADNSLFAVCFTNALGLCNSSTSAQFDKFSNLVKERERERETKSLSSEVQFSLEIMIHLQLKVSPGDLNCSFCVCAQASITELCFPLCL